MKPRYSILVPFLALFLLTACKSLDPAGPYQGNRALYDADVAIAASYDAIHTFVKWEFDHRTELAQFPHIKIAVDNIRREAPGAFRTAIMLRDLYATNNADSSKTALQQAVAILQQMTSLAISTMSKYQVASGDNLNPVQ